jgi:hypothetical protein
MLNRKRLYMVRKVENDNGTVQYIQSRFDQYNDKHKETGATRYVISPLLYAGLDHITRQYFMFEDCSFALMSHEYNEKYAESLQVLEVFSPPFITLFNNFLTIYILLSNYIYTLQTTHLIYYFQIFRKLSTTSTYKKENY